MSEPAAPVAVAPRPLLPSTYGPALLSSFFIGLAIIYSRGAYSEAALLMVLLGTGTLVVTSRLTLRTSWISFRAVLPLLWVGVFGLAWIAWNDREIIIYPHRYWVMGRDAQACGLVLLLTYLPFIEGRWKEPRALRWFRIVGFAAALLVGGVDTIKSSPVPHIDAWAAQQSGVAYLSRGQNPYTHVNVADTGPTNLPRVPYVYPPTQLYLTLPAYLLGGDVRYGMLAAVVLSGFLLRFIVRRGGRTLPAFAEDAPALFLWLTPKLFFVIEQSWVDPIQLMLIIAAAAAYLEKRTTLSAVLFGLVLTSKQTMFWVVGIAGLTLGFTRKQWLIIGGVGVAMVLPFALWSFADLRFSIYDVLSGLPPRVDALTFNNWVWHRWQLAIPGGLAFVLAAVAVGLTAWKLRGSKESFGVAVAMTYLLFFAFNRWAFANYYFLIAGLSALAGAVAFHTPAVTPAPVDSPQQT